MKNPIIRRLLLLATSPHITTPLKNSSTLLLIKRNASSSSSTTTTTTKTGEENLIELVSKANLLIPRLCESNHLRDAIRVFDAILLTTPPLHSLSSLAVLIDRVTDEPNMTHSMALLNRLHHSTSIDTTALLADIVRMLVDSYFKKRRVKESMKVFDWMLNKKREKDIATEMYEMVIRELCRSGGVLESLKVLRKMVGVEAAEQIVVVSDVRTWVLKGLLREARIGEAREIDRAFDRCGVDGDGFQRLVELIDRIVGDWKD